MAQRHEWMPRRRRVGTMTSTAAVIAALAVAVVGGPGPLAPQAASADGPVLLFVTTTADTISPVDGGCSLRAALAASNSGGVAGYCGSGSGLGDGIEFALGAGTPVINIFTPLPEITAPVLIDGGTSRVRLQGPGSGTGLSVTASGVTLRGLVVDGFTTGIVLGGTGGKVAGSVIGPNSGDGILAVGGGTIGGTAGLSSNGACAGDCNVIAGNGGAGLYLLNGGTVVGNHIGVNAAGTTAVANGSGILISSGTWTVGGTAAGTGNTISGNVGDGLFANGCACTIRGNRIGTTSTGSSPIANGGNGIRIQSSFSVAIGGNLPGAGNIVSGNLGDGIAISTSTGVTISANRIGVGVTGNAIANGNDGVDLRGDSGGIDNALIGYELSPDIANTIAHNVGAGIRIGAGGSNNRIRMNVIHSNGAAGIVLEGGANDGITPPVITGFGFVRGTACANCFVDVFSDSADEGRIYHGLVSAGADGAWVLEGWVRGPNVTATATNASGDTSAFSAPFSVAPPFTDTATSPFRTEIDWLYAQRITTGCSSTLYCPDATVTRQQMASFLVRMFRLPATATDYFEDDETSIHEADINALRQAGVTTGCTATTFCPTAPVKRDQMASFLARAGGMTSGDGRDYFGDDDGNIHEINIDRAAAAGVASGCGSYLYCPSGTVTRGQMAAFLYRIVYPVASPPYPAP